MARGGKLNMNIDSVRSPGVLRARRGGSRSKTANEPHAKRRICQKFRQITDGAAVFYWLEAIDARNGFQVPVVSLVEMDS